jgi:hypothetical protein
VAKEQRQTVERKPTEKELQEKEILQRLADLGGQQVQDDALIFQGDKFIVPRQFEHSEMDDILQFLRDYDEARQEMFSTDRSFQYHPYDVGNSFQRVMKRIFGTTGVSKRMKMETFFGTFTGPPPEMKSVRVSPTEHLQVPWGMVKMPLLDASFEIDFVRDPRSKQPVGHIQVVAPRRFRSQIEGVFTAIERDLTEQSIYRGKAIDANWLDPEFLDLATVREDKVAYSAATRTQLNANVWSVVQHSDRLVGLGMSLKRAVLLEGPYGCGKSLTGMLTAQKAVANGWTFVYCRPGQDLAQALHAAKLLSPCVVFFEDLDVVAEPQEGPEDPGKISQLLDLFDGVANKNTPIVAVVTTNHVERIHRGMLRPGRLDAVVHIGELDGEGVETLVRSVLPEKLRGKIDYGQSAEAMKGFLPAFIKEAAERALRFAVARSDGEVQQVNTEDLVAAAASLRPQLELMENAGERPEREALAKAFGGVIHGTLQGSRVVDESEDINATLSLPDGNMLDSQRR